MRLANIFSITLILLFIFIAYHFSSNAIVSENEIYRGDELEQSQRSVENFISVIEKNKTDYLARGAHSKGHACVKAYFDINEDIPINLRQGVFSVPGQSFKSWIRFSNGASSMKNNYDSNKDARGMAIKLFKLDGLSNKEVQSEHQDFLMHDAAVFFAANIEDYNRFVESENKILYFVSGANPLKWRIRELMHGLATLKEPPASLLQNQYFSNTAYKLGPHNIKFSAKPCVVKEKQFEADSKSPDFLRTRMIEELTKDNACFHFMVQLQKLDKYMPIEDPSIEWKESDSPFIPIATITIPRQEFNQSGQQSFCENLSFSPWNALVEHRPIGQLNRIRKAVYAASSQHRHEKNQAEVPTNLDW